MTSKQLIFFIIWLTAVLAPRPAVSQTLVERRRVHVANAEQFIEEGQFLKALQEASEARSNLPDSKIASEPDAAHIYYWMGRCYLALTQAELASSRLDSALAFVAAQDSQLRYSIEVYRGLARKELRPILSAIQYFEGSAHKNKIMIGEAKLAFGTLCLHKNDPVAAGQALEQSLTVFKNTPTNSANKGKCLQLNGYYAWRIRRAYAEALDYFKKAEAIFVQLGGAESDHLAALYINMGGCLDEMGEIRKALDLYKIAQQKLLNMRSDHPTLINVYNNFGNSYVSLGEYAASIQYLEKTTTLDPGNGRYWNNLGDAYLSQENWQQAEICFNKALPLLFQVEKPNFAEIARPYHNLGIIYRNRGQLDSALAYELRSIPYRKSDPKDLLGIARSYLGAGECYLKQGKFRESIVCLDSALLLQSRALPAHLYSETSVAYDAKGRVKAALGDYNTAFALIDSALYASGYRKGNSWNEVTARPEMLAALERKAALHYTLFKINGSASELEAAVSCFDTAAQAVRFFRNALLDSESKATLSGQFRDILSGGVEAALALHRLRPKGDDYLRLAFAFSEQSKALVLLEGVRSAGVLKFEGVPDSILAQERNLRESVTEAEVVLKKLTYSGKGVGEGRLAAAQSALFDRQRRFERFQQMLQTSEEFRAYHEFRYGASLVTPEFVQAQLLHPESTMLSYFIGKENRITAFVLNKSDIRAIDCGQTADLDSLVETLRKGLFGYFGLAETKRRDDILEKTVSQYIAAGQALYAKLLAPVEQLLRKEIMIVPDGLLAKIPFELLLTASPSDPFDFGEYPYWFKTQNHSVSYVYSATLLREMTQKQHRETPALPFFAMAPFFPGTHSDIESHKSIAELPNVSTPGLGKRNFKPLPYSGEELRDISTLWNGQYAVGKACTKALFLREAPRVRMLHLSTHGVLDSSFSYLALTPAEGEITAEPLYLRDLYNLQLNADLVTLSACETGLGEFQRGEGVISLARAFAYAGAKSIVNSLWQVDNAATKDLMALFYGNLKTGKSKNIALRDAKLSYLNNPARASEQLHPFFWAGLVAVGDMRPIR